MVYCFGMNLAYLQSGGPTAVINRSLAGALERFLSLTGHCHFYGVRHAIDGLINGDLVDLSGMSADNVKLVGHTNGAFLGSSRTSLKEADESVFKAIRKTIDDYKIDAILVNGGNDSMCTAKVLSEHFPDVRCIGVPKTVDNDLFGIPYAPGYLTAANYVANVCLSIMLDSRVYKKGKITLIETMGRDTGWLSLAASVLPSDVKMDGVFIPEEPFSFDRFAVDAKSTFEKKGYAMYVFSEGIASTDDDAIDSFGNRSVEGSCDIIAEKLKKLGLPVRVVRLSIPQRSSRAYPSELDDRIAAYCGAEAVRYAFEGKTGLMAGYRLDGDELCPSPIPLEEVAGKTRFASMKDVEDIKKRINLAPYLLLK